MSIKPTMKQMIKTKNSRKLSTLNLKNQNCSDSTKKTVKLLLLNHTKHLSLTSKKPTMKMTALISSFKAMTSGTLPTVLMTNNSWLFAKPSWISQFTYRKLIFASTKLLITVPKFLLNSFLNHLAYWSLIFKATTLSLKVPSTWLRPLRSARTCSS